MPHKIPISLYFFAIVALVLLAPYAGCHILTSRPVPITGDTWQEPVSPSDTATHGDQEKNLVDLNQLLDK